MKVKIIINGNGFHYGRVLVSYLPFDQYDDLSSNAALVKQDLIQASQQPHLFLNPTLSLGGEMSLPFFSASNYLNIPEETWREMGHLYFRTLNVLKHANGATDQVTITVFAWAEDVNFNVLTDFEPQSGTEVDQANRTGMISGPATAIAKVAGSLIKVPYLSPFAMATSIGSESVAAIAKLFGYCRPPVTKACEPYRPTVISSLALTNTPDTVQKLTVDDKQELTIDPRVSGLGGIDPFNIRDIASRESYLTSFTWQTGTAPETLLWNSRVSPVLWDRSGSGDTAPFHFPACAVAALPFQYWTGSMKFRFQIVASTFHKGRLKFVYDPNEIPATSGYNVNYLRIVDIADENDFTIEIGNGQQYTLVSHALPGVDPLQFSAVTPVFKQYFNDNGGIGVYIVNELTTPNSTANNDIEVNVFVSMGDDFEVFVPDDTLGEFTFKPFEAQSGEEGLTPESLGTTEPDKPQQAMSMNLGPGVQDTELVNKVFTGESIQSFRTMLKRYNLHESFGTYQGGEYLISGRRSWFPYLRGAVAGAVHQTSTAQAYNYCNTILLHWISNCFSGKRGSIRYKIVPRSDISVENTITVRRAPFSFGSLAYVQSFGPTLTYTSNSQIAESAVMKDDANNVPRYGSPFTGTTGSAYTYSNVNGTMEFEMPYYSSLRFTPGKQDDYTAVQRWDACWDFYIALHDLTGVTKQQIYDIYAAAGEDYQCYFWTGMPRLYYEPTPPTAA
jgi:hypothetical protein